ncbi:MAG TPA: AIR synthase-related protein, partial [Terriglobales bacterium]|nr:AIR synthase-related protein [Terriglobales bacterium]
QREGLEFETTIRSDSAALHGLVGEMLKVTGEIRCMRDPTRGGLASALNEIADQSQVGIELEESAIPIREEVRGACEILGLDSLYVANEGKLIAIVAPDAEHAVLRAMRGHALGGEAQAIGTVRHQHPGLVTMRTVLGTTRVVDMLEGDQLPRIC